LGVNSAFASNSAEVIVSGSENLVYMWSVADGSVRTILSGQDNPVDVLMYSPCGAYLAASCESAGTVSLWDIVSGDPNRPRRHRGRLPLDADAIFADPSAASCAACQRLETKVASLNDTLEAMRKEIETLRGTAPTMSFTPQVMMGRGDLTKRVVDSGSLEYSFVVDLFYQGRRTPREFSVVSVEVVGCDKPHAAYIAKRRHLMIQKDKRIGNETGSDLRMKFAALERLGPHFRTRDRGAKEILAWVGCPEGTVDKIVEKGFEVGNGSFGFGVQNVALQGEYACLCATNELSLTELPLERGTTCCVVLSWVCVGAVYPLTRACDYDHLSEGPSRFAENSSLQVGYTAHLAGVAQALEFEIPPDVAKADYDVLVIGESSQVLPQYIVRFRNAKPNGNP
jgi:hypothetical protein